MERTKLLPGECCDDYMQYVTEMGEDEPGKLLRVGRHLLAHNGRCDTVAFLATRKKRDHGGDWVQGFRAARLKIPLYFLESPDMGYLQSLLTVPRILPTASRADVCSATGLPSQCAYDFGDSIVRNVRLYRAFSGECALCNAIVGPNLLVAAGMVAEAEAAAQEREVRLKWIRSHKPALWDFMLNQGGARKNEEQNDG